VVDALAFLAESAETPLRVPVGQRGGMRQLMWGGEADGFSMVVDMVGVPQYESGEGKERHQYSLGLTAEQGGFYVHSESLLYGAVKAHRGVWGHPPVFARDYGMVTVLMDPLDDSGVLEPREVQVAADETALYALRDPRAYFVLNHLRRYISGFNIHNGFELIALRQPYDPSSRTWPDTRLQPDGANMVGVVGRLMTDVDFGEAWEEFWLWVTLAYPYCDKVGVADVGSGALQALQWREYEHKTALSAGQLSDGVLRFLCLAVLCASPEPPPLVAIDEPEIGLHPGLLPLVAAMLEALSERTQVLVITHSPQLLSGFRSIDCIRVISKDEEGAHAHRPGDSKALRAMLEPTIGASLGQLFESGELEIPRPVDDDAEGEH